MKTKTFLASLAVAGLGLFSLGVAADTAVLGLFAATTVALTLLIATQDYMGRRSLRLRKPKTLVAINFRDAQPSHANPFAA
ncbi:MAG TPA: hypothetical protein VKC60_01895 [Opitutaceae bacterium]|nr:hypothetical protein [Opitutaceae bacterium]